MHRDSNSGQFGSETPSQVYYPITPYYPQSAEVHWQDRDHEGHDAAWLHAGAPGGAARACLSLRATELKGNEASDAAH